MQISALQGFTDLLLERIGRRRGRRKMRCALSQWIVEGVTVDVVPTQGVCSARNR
jgi:hypothetical protein